MTVLSTTAQAAGLTLLVMLAFIAVGFVFLTDVGRPVAPVPVTNSAEVGSTGRRITPAQATPSAVGQAPTPLALTGVDATSPRLNVAEVSAAGVPADRGESVPKVEVANNPAAAQEPGLVGKDNYNARPEAPASVGAGETAPPANAANVTPPALGAAERPRPRTAGELARPLALMGHRVHAALSGDGQSMTLSISGATLKREDAARWLGSVGARRELKAAGVRVVVLVSGSESWTFML